MWNSTDHDGNMKNHRDVCFASSAGYTEYDGLPGSIKTGCPNTPDFKSRYCKLHTPTVATSHPVSLSDDGEPNVLICEKTNDFDAECPVAMILSKRQTRQTTFYKVVIIIISIIQSHPFFIITRLLGLENQLLIVLGNQLLHFQSKWYQTMRQDYYMISRTGVQQLLVKTYIP